MGNSIAHTARRKPYLDTVGNGNLLDWNYYPLDDYKHENGRTAVQDIVINTGMQFTILPGLHVDLKYLYERQHSGREDRRDEESYFVRNEINTFAQVSPNGSVKYIVPRGGVLNIGGQILQANNLRGQLNFSREWHDHEIVSLFGAEVRAADHNSHFNRYWGFNEKTMTLGSVDYTNTYPARPGTGLRYIFNPESVTEKNNNYISSFANASYIFRKRYIATGSMRRDASNLFGLNTNDQWNPFWSLGIAWNISEEPFYHIGTVPQLKLRATYGSSGNIDPAMAATTTMVYFAGVLPTTQTPQARFATFYNPELRWETSNMLNIALDFRVSSNRAWGSIEYFHKKGLNLFGEAQLDYTGGVGTSITKNVASMKTSGLDLSLTTVNIDQAFKWYSTLNLSYAADEVTDFYVRSMNASNFVTNYSGLGKITGMKGTPVHSVYAYRWGGLDPETGNPRGYLDGEIATDYRLLTGSANQVSNLKYFGSAVPTTFGSFLNSFSYAGISVDMSIIYKFGYFFRRPALSYGTLYQLGVGHKEYAQRWQNPGDELHTQVPSMVYPADSNRDRYYEYSEATVEKGDHVRLQYINIAYTLASPWSGRIGLDNVQVFMNVSNLGLLWRANNRGIDPDYVSSQYQTGSPRQISLGLKFNL